MSAALPACLRPRPALTVYGSVPPGCFGFLVEGDECEPILRDGEFAIIDTADREPDEGALFLIEWSNGDREIVETFQRPNRQADGTEALRWWCGAFNRPRGLDELNAALRRGTVSTIDGPYARTEYLAEKLIGMVVGVLAPDRHTRDEMSRRDYARNRPANLPPHPYSDGLEPGYVQPAGSAAYRRRAR